MSSIHTNKAALQALQAVNAASRDLAASQTRVSTGLKVTGAKDNAAIWSIAQGMRADIAGWGAVGDGLARGQSILDIAAHGTEVISDLLIELKQRAVALNDSHGAQAKAAIRADMEALIRQIDQVARTSAFDGVNLLTGAPLINTITRTTYSSSHSLLIPADFTTPMGALPPGSSLVSSLSSPKLVLPPSALTPASFEAALATITGQDSQTVLVDAGDTAGRVNLLLNAFGAADRVEIWQNGVRVAATGRPYAPDGEPVDAALPVSYDNLLSFDYDPANGQILELRINEGGATGTGWEINGLILQDPSEPVPTPIPTWRTVTTVQTTASFDPPLLTADPEQVAAERLTPPEGVSAVHTLDGGPVAGRVDMVFDAFDLPDVVEVWQGGVRVAASGRAYDPGGGAVGPGLAVTGQNQISFNYDPASGPIEFVFNDGGADPNSAWVVGGLTLQPFDEPISSSEGVTSGQQEPGFGPKNYDFLISPEGAFHRITTRDLTASNLGLDPDDLAWNNPASILAAINAAHDTVIEAASYFGARQTLFASLSEQVSKLSDTLETGVGNLVDANMAKEAAKLQAAQVKQQLAVQTLGIANAAPQWLLNLFRD